MKRVRLVWALLLAACASPGANTPADPGARLGTLGASYAVGTARPAAKIDGVWLNQTQCGGVGVAVLLQTHPDRDALLAQRSFDFPSGDLRVAFPQLPDFESLDVRVSLDDTSRGHRDDYLSFSDRPGAPVYAAVVRTERPAALRGDASAMFAAIRRTVGQMSYGTSPQDLAVRDLDGPWGRLIEVLLRNQVGTPCFPTSAYRQLPPGLPYRTVGVNRFLVRDTAVIHLALIVNIPKHVSESAQGEYARERMDEFMGSLTLR